MGHDDTEEWSKQCTDTLTPGGEDSLAVGSFFATHGHTPTNETTPFEQNQSTSFSLDNAGGLSLKDR